ncbi:hypothetical protein V565_197830 [Rhizoctonia solani 123E]|uniref:Uncharacterized protein n=1 Tax=Rhizoctonia solani 123E TaxID=1423351 RepID=A0A074RP42_9AGAM|nr:hypothetical protein V565_197830 [Rhizoctonia solani 123E]
MPDGTTRFKSKGKDIYHFVCCAFLAHGGDTNIATRNPEAFRASAGRPPEKKEEVDHILKTIEDPGFWNQLTELKLYLEPLAIAANVSQASATRLDHILIELGRLYHAFSQLGFNPKIREIVLESLERRWGKANQDPFILAVFLNPFIRGRLFSRENTLLNRSGVYRVVKRVFRRIFRKENDLKLYKAFLDYYEFRNEFSPDRWDYREQQAVHEEAAIKLRTRGDTSWHTWRRILCRLLPIRLGVKL